MRRGYSRNAKKATTEALEALVQDPEMLEALRGPQGETGPAGPQGEPGQKGDTGAVGPPGPPFVSKTVTQTLPAVALGGSYSFTVPVEGATLADFAILTPPTSLLGNSWKVEVTSPGVVSVTLRAGASIGAGAATFRLALLKAAS